MSTLATCNIMPLKCNTVIIDKQITVNIIYSVLRVRQVYT